MGALVALPDTITWPKGKTLLASGEVAVLLGVERDRLTHWRHLGLIDVSVTTVGGHARFSCDDVQTFLRQATRVGRLGVGDIVACSDWNGGEPVRVLHVAGTHRGEVSVRWQDVSAHAPAVAVTTGHGRIVRRLHREATPSPPAGAAGGLWITEAGVSRHRHDPSREGRAICGRRIRYEATAAHARYELCGQCELLHRLASSELATRTGDVLAEHDTSDKPLPTPRDPRNPAEDEMTDDDEAEYEKERTT
ncbi:MerR family transcriptional regulator [Streptosporangium sp. NPDC023963]|uniref:MerR family transcriptional regulator n=1 Tax=Streptosporangium sp. NPDC023963 TaxID=3155608 RepID=UPI00342C1D02